MSIKVVSGWLIMGLAVAALVSCASGDEQHYTPTQEYAQHSDFETQGLTSRFHY